ncbi:hypothetical protein HZI73_26325 (plasmid) [Vallitalea pronyensis]|uniref:Uncharacterized protein n=1 Tax=Vallitalea pronyensis TaxID=1348613 RepID=A0A8J8SJX2_9FIRM|nr:hypothetical protein [Vallitalea pronyensis]QUI25932.1 hypothetical protein HZI73_26325 [Vallitalea pronyensis]
MIKLPITVTPKGNPVIEITSTSPISGYAYHPSMPDLLLFKKENQKEIVKPHRGMLLLHDDVLYRMVQLCRHYEGDLQEAKKNGTISYSIRLTPSSVDENVYESFRRGGELA